MTKSFGLRNQHGRKRACYPIARETGGGAEITVDDGRGGSALLAKVRSAQTLNGMSNDKKWIAVGADRAHLCTFCG